MSSKKKEYVERVLNAVSIKIGSAIESNYDSIWSLSCTIDDYIKAAIEEAYDKGHDDGYNEAMNEASYEYDRKRGYL